MAIITLRGIEKVYRTKEIETTALENVNLEVEAGEFVSIMGPSGCGKSTLLNIIGLLDKPTKGTVSILGQECGALTDTGLSHFRNANLGFVFQSFHLIPTLDVAANIELPLTYRKGVGASERRRRVEQVAQRLEMTHRLHHTPAQLSGGQCQRVAIARAIVGRPQIILADEPTGNLDPLTAEGIIRLFQEIARQGCAVVMSTHNTALIEEYPSRTILFSKGKIKEVPVQTMLQDI